MPHFGEKIAEAIQRVPHEGTLDAEQIVDIPVPQLRERIAGFPSASASNGDPLTRACGVPHASASDVFSPVPAVLHVLARLTRASGPMSAPSLAQRGRVAAAWGARTFHNRCGS